MLDEEEVQLFLPIKCDLAAKPHQLEGIRFMFTKVKSDVGCILAHTVGLGKVCIFVPW